VTYSRWVTGGSWNLPAWLIGWDS